MKLLNLEEIGGWSGSGEDIGNFYIIRARAYKGMFKVIKIEKATPFSEVIFEIAVENAPNVENEEDIWKIINELGLHKEVFDAICKKNFDEGFYRGQEEVRKQLRNIFGI